MDGKFGRLGCVAIAGLLWGWAALSCTGEGTVTPQDTGAGGGDTSRVRDGDDGGSDGGERADTNDEERRITSMAVEPSDVVLTAENGGQPTADFALRVFYNNGDSEEWAGDVDFEVADRRIGTIDRANGQFEASGVTGGTTRVQATIPSKPGVGAASTDVTVKLKYEIEGQNLPSDFADKFASVTKDAKRAAGVVYPLDGAVMPQNVYPADIQWQRGTKGDLFRVQITKPNARVTAYLAHNGQGFGNHWRVDEEAWRALARTAPREPAEIQVTRWVADDGEAVAGESAVSFRFAKGSLTGSVYYWDISATRIKRIDDGSGKAESFMPDPPNSRNNGQNCVGCHSVSNDGRYMVGRLGPGDNIGGVFDLTKDLSQKPVPTEFPIRDDGPRWWFSTWSPDDSRLMVTQGSGRNQRLSLMDPKTGKILEPKEGTLPDSGVTHPAWSPDDSLVAYVTGGNRWGGELDQGDIATLPVTGQDKFGAPRTLLKAADVPNAHPGGDTASYPTWSPDSQWIAFAHGSGARSQEDTSALYMMARDGTDVVRLDRANGGPKTDDTFQPNFSPFETGEYFWLSYLSKRPYGNKHVGTRGAKARQQIWVSAIQKNPAPGEDPSQVGFWLPGQSTESRNISAFWAPRACRDNGEKCTVDSECCGGECVEDGEGQLRCSPPKQECRKLNETCTQDSDCCDEALTKCVGRVCVPRGG